MPSPTNAWWAQANREKAEGWLGRNAIVVTALNPLIGYSAGAALVKEAGTRVSAT
jgi:fumarate hydratase class II